MDFYIQGVIITIGYIKDYNYLKYLYIVSVEHIHLIKLYHCKFYYLMYADCRCKLYIISNN